MSDIPSSPQCLDLGCSNVPLFPVRTKNSHSLNGKRRINLFSLFSAVYYSDPWQNIRQEINVSEDITSMDLRDKTIASLHTIKDVSRALQFKAVMTNRVNVKTFSLTDFQGPK